MVGFSTTNFTRAWEPTLSWNQLRSEPGRECNGELDRRRLVTLGIAARYDPVLVAGCGVPEHCGPHCGLAVCALPGRCGSEPRRCGGKAGLRAVACDVADSGGIHCGGMGS